VGDGLAIEQNLSAAGAKAAADQIEKRRFPSAIRANDGNTLTGMDGQIDASDNFSLAETFVKVFEFQCEGHHAASLRLISFSISVWI
jgi:hypothetical protein